MQITRSLHTNNGLWAATHAAGVSRFILLTLLLLNLTVDPYFTAMKSYFSISIPNIVKMVFQVNDFCFPIFKQCCGYEVSNFPYRRADRRIHGRPSESCSGRAGPGLGVHNDELGREVGAGTDSELMMLMWMCKSV